MKLKQADRSALFVAAAVIALIVGGGLWSYQVWSTRIALLPAEPAVEGVPAELRTRLERAQARVRGWTGGHNALRELSRLYHANGFLDEARRCYQALERLEPDEPRWWHRHATLLAGFGELEEAAGRWERVVHLAPRYLPAQLRYADLLLKRNRTGEARAMFERVLRRNAEEPYAHLGLARIEVEAGRWEEARRRLEPLVAKSNYELGYDLIVSVYEALGEKARAAEIRGRAKAAGAYRDLADPWVDDLLEDCFDSHRLALEAGGWARRGDFGVATRWLQRALTHAPDDVAVRFQLAGVLVERRDVAGAQRELERCTQIKPDFADAWAHWAALRLQAGDPAGAAKLVAAGLQHNPASAGLHLMRARQWREAGRLEEAVGAYQTAIRYRPNEAEAYLELGTTLFRLERVPEGRQVLEAGLRAEPEHPPTLALLAFDAISNGDERAAEALMVRVKNQPRVAREQNERLRLAFQARFGRAAP